MFRVAVLAVLMTLVSAQQNVLPLWNVSQSAAIYTSANVARATTMAPLQFGGGTWLDTPYMCAGYNVDGSLAWQYDWPNPTDEVDMKTYSLKTTATTDGNLPPVSLICVANVQANKGAGVKSITVLAFAPNQQNATPVWRYDADSHCQTDSMDSFNDAAISGDGSTVAVLAVCRNTTDPFIAQVHVLETTAGKATCVYSVNSLASQAGGVGLSLSANGQYAAWNNFEQAYVINTRTCASRIVPNGGVLQMGFEGVVAMSGDAQYLVWGFETGSILNWNSAQQTYVLAATVPGIVNGSQWYCESVAVTPDLLGYPIAAFGWTDGNAATARVDVWTLGDTPAALWSWVGPTSRDDQLIPSDIAIWGSYIAVATWGDYHESTNPCPQVYLFATDGGASPIFSYVTPGSMFAIDVVSYTVQHPMQPPNDEVWVVASGKHVHANQMGNGGDMFVFSWQD